MSITRSDSDLRAFPASSSVPVMRAAATLKGARSARARRWIFSTALSPMPRLGVLTMRSKARSSAGWLTTRK